MRKLAMALVVPVMFFGALVSWAFASPVGSSPDDDYHMASIWCAGGLTDLCQAGNAPSERKVPDVLLTSSNCFAFDSTQSASCPTEPVTELILSDRGNFVGSYPPVFYATMNLFAGSDVAASVLVMRIVNALLFVGIVSGLYFTLKRSQRGPLLWGSLIALVPLGVFIIPSVNPSSWAVLSAATLWVSLIGYFSATTTRLRIVFASFAGLVTIMGAGARSDSAVYSGIAVVVAIILTFERSLRYLKLAAVPIALAIVAVVFFLASGQSAVVDPSSAPNELSMTETIGLTITNLLQLPSLWVGALGTWGLGWLDTPMPAVVWVSSAAVFFAVAFWGIQRMGARKGIVLAIVFVSLVIVPLYVLVKDGITVGVGVQPRYILPLLIMFAGLSLLGLKSLNLGLTRVQVAVIGVLLSAANSVALHANLRRYVTGTDGGPNLDSAIEWWWAVPISPMAIWALGSIFFAIAMFGVYVHVVRTPVSAELLENEPASPRAL